MFKVVKVPPHAFALTHIRWEAAAGDLSKDENEKSFLEWLSAEVGICMEAVAI